MLLFWIEASYGFMMPRFSIEETVLDESGAPVEGATVRADYLGATASDGSVERAWTDSGGIATVTGRSVFYVALTASKDGFYQSGTRVYAKEVVNGKEAYPDRKIKVVLREKRNPIPLYAKRYSGEIPVAEEWIGFDLEVGGWVAPYGKGTSADILFRYEGTGTDFFNAQGKLEIKFPSPGDGIADISREVDYSSQLRIPHEASVDGYTLKEKRWSYRIGKGVLSTEYSRDESKFYFLRVRSSVDDEGNILQSNYAKIYRDIAFDPRMKKHERGVAWVVFTYYFNPTPNDHNLEFDTNRNLFGKLHHEKQIREP
jgi:hypothetical protein